MDTLSKLGWLAAEILLQDHPTAKEYQPQETAIVLANKNASLDTDIKYFETAKEIASPALFVYTLPNIVTGEICIRHHFKGENAFFIQQQFDADFIREYVEVLLNNQIASSCICGWVECLDEQYKVLLMYVEKKESTTSSIAFTTDNILKLYSTENG